jgi:hypothetical protein
VHRILPLIALTLCACDETTGGWRDADAPPDTYDAAPDPVLDTTSDPLPETVPDTPTDPLEEEPGPSPVCARWNADTADMSEGEWSGSTDGCVAGDMSTGWRERALRLTNLARWLAGMPETALSTSSNASLQECALIMQANGRLSHSPPSDWSCYTSGGAGAAGNSNLAPSGAVRSIGMYLADYGNASTMGHRRWILSHGLDNVGFGSTNGYSCMQVLHMVGGSDPEWIAWPSPGDWPAQASHWISTSWTIQSNSIDLRAGHASVTLDGVPLEMETNDLYGGYGSSYAISFEPLSSRWSIEAGQTYHVEITGISASISYDVHMVDCDP